MIARLHITIAGCFIALLALASPLSAQDAGTDAGALTLSQCLALAEKNNADIKIARAKVAEAEASYKGKLGLLLPQIDANLSYDRYREQLPSKKQRFGESLDDYYAELVMKLPLFQGGKNWGKIKAAKMNLDAEKQRLELARRTVSIAVKRAYYERVRSAITLDIQKELSKNLEEQVSIAKLLYAGGKFSVVDMLKVETQAASAKDALKNAENALRIRSLALGRILGLETPVETSTDVEIIESNFTISRACLAEGFSKNPEILTAQFQLEKSRYDEMTAEGAHYPYLSLRGNYNVEDKTFFPGNPNWYVGVIMTIPIFHGGSDAAAVSEVKARTAQYQAKLDDVRKELAVRFESSEATIIDSLNRLATTAKVLALAEESYKTSLLKYKSGKLSALELIDAQTVWYNARLGHKKLLIDTHITMAEIEQICPHAVVRQPGGKQ